MTKTMCGTDCWTDHRLVVSKLHLRIQPDRRPQGKKAPKRLDFSKPARVQNDGEYSEPFPVTNGAKQGCVMAPTLFSMMFSAILTGAFQVVEAGFLIRYRFDGKLLNLRGLQAKSADKCG